MEPIQRIAFDLIRNGNPKMAARLRKVVAFDTRFSLYQKDIKYMYLLESPIFDQRFELIHEDGSKRLINDNEAVDILKREREYNEMIREKAAEQVKKVNKLAKMSDLPMDPDFEALQQDIQKEAPDVSPLLEVHNDDKKKSKIADEATEVSDEEE